MAAAACLAASVLGTSVAIGGTGKENERTTLPAPVGDVVPPLGTPAEAVSALEHLRLHPGRESLDPAESTRHRPSGTTEEQR